MQFDMEEEVRCSSPDLASAQPSSKARGMLSPNTVVGNRWRLKTALSNGQFGSVIVAEDVYVVSGPTVVKACTTAHAERSIELEHEVYLAVNYFLSQTTRLPSYFYMRKAGFVRLKEVISVVGRKAIVLQRVGADLQRTLEMEPTGCLSYCDIASLAAQVVHSLSVLHQTGYVHRDVKPLNLAYNQYASWSLVSKRVYLLDFGLAQKIHFSGIGASEKKGPGTLPAGSFMFASLAAHEQRQQFPKDDLESLMYTIAYLATGSLPWSQLRFSEPTSQTWSAVGAFKRTVFQEMSLFDKLPNEFRVAYSKVIGMPRDAFPDYEPIINAFEFAKARIKGPEVKRYPDSI